MVDGSRLRLLQRHGVQDAFGIFGVVGNHVPATAYVATTPTRCPSAEAKVYDTLRPGNAVLSSSIGPASTCITAATGAWTAQCRTEPGLTRTVAAGVPVCGARRGGAAPPVSQDWSSA